MEASSNDHHITLSEPLLKSNTRGKGGLATLPFIIAHEAFEQLASGGLAPNMILYLTREYNMEASKGTNVIFFWTAASAFLPTVGAVLADSFVGRYRMIGFGTVATLLGMVLLCLTTIIPQARPKPCVQFGENCETATASQLLLLYSSFAFMSIGAGGIRSCTMAFGADQLRKSDKCINARSLETFVTWYYATVLVSIITATTCIVYIQDALGWKVGFGVPLLLMILSTISFFLAAPFYIKSDPDSSLFIGFAQVLVASYTKRNVEVSNARNVNYHHQKGSKLVVPTNNLRFLNKACIITNSEEKASTDSNSWSLCTVDQVEELKRLIKVVPIWLSGVMFYVTTTQGSFAVLQASTLDRHFTPKFEIPAGSFHSFALLTLLIWIVLYDRVIIPVISKLKGKHSGLTLKQKMGIGILFSSASMAAFAILEGVRRETAIRQGFADNPNAVLGISAMWSLPYHIFFGLGEAFSNIGRNEFYFAELSKSMASVAVSLLQLGTSAANLVSSFIVSTVDNFTKRTGKESWVSSNINKGHYDYYFWILAGLSLVNFMFYLGCCKAYGPCSNSDNKDHDENDGIDENDK